MFFFWFALIRAAVCELQSFIKCSCVVSSYVVVNIVIAICYNFDANSPPQTQKCKKELSSHAHMHARAHELLYLPYSHYSISNENEEDDEGFNKGCDRSLSFFKPSQCLQETRDRGVCRQQDCTLRSSASI